MRRTKWAWTALALALVLSACRGPAPAVETPVPTPTATAPAVEAEGLDFVLPCYPGGGFHPITGGNRTNLTLSPLMYRGLFALDRTFQPRNDLCAGYTVSEDGLTWTFRLAAATFSDNTPLTGVEAAASLNLALNAVIHARLQPVPPPSFFTRLSRDFLAASKSLGVSSLLICESG